MATSIKAQGNTRTLRFGGTGFLPPGAVTSAPHFLHRSFFPAQCGAARYRWPHSGQSNLNSTKSLAKGAFMMES
jgi:hypothetical protein